MKISKMVLYAKDTTIVSMLDTLQRNEMMSLLEDFLRDAQQIKHEDTDEVAYIAVGLNFDVKNALKVLSVFRDYFDNNTYRVIYEVPENENLPQLTTNVGSMIINPLIVTAMKQNVNEKEPFINSLEHLIILANPHYELNINVNDDGVVVNVSEEGKQPTVIPLSEAHVIELQEQLKRYVKHKSGKKK